MTSVVSKNTFLFSFGEETDNVICRTSFDGVWSTSLAGSLDNESAARLLIPV